MNELDLRILHRACGLVWHERGQDKNENLHRRSSIISSNQSE